jgi:hypothetical protein
MPPDSLAATGAGWTIETLSVVTVRVGLGVVVTEVDGDVDQRDGTVDHDSWSRKESCVTGSSGSMV